MSELVPANPCGVESANFSRATTLAVALTFPCEEWSRKAGNPFKGPWHFLSKAMLDDVLKQALHPQNRVSLWEAETLNIQNG
jgi:hypothetical protein